jgi:hypothetical protein
MPPKSSEAGTALGCFVRQSTSIVSDVQPGTRQTVPSPTLDPGDVSGITALNPAPVELLRMANTTCDASLPP